MRASPFGPAPIALDSVSRLHRENSNPHREMNTGAGSSALHIVSTTLGVGSGRSTGSDSPDSRSKLRRRPPRTLLRKIVLLVFGFGLSLVAYYLFFSSPTTVIPHHSTVPLVQVEP